MCGLNFKSYLIRNYQLKKSANQQRKANSLPINHSFIQIKKPNQNTAARERSIITHSWPIFVAGNYCLCHQLPIGLGLSLPLRAPGPAAHRARPQPTPFGHLDKAPVLQGFIQPLDCATNASWSKEVKDQDIMGVHHPKEPPSTYGELMEILCSTTSPVYWTPWGT